eukprot:PhM_4_TR13114/c0_g1_i1/m.70652
MFKSNYFKRYSIASGLPSNNNKDTTTTTTNSTTANKRGSGSGGTDAVVSIVGGGSGSDRSSPLDQSLAQRRRSSTAQQSDTNDVSNGDLLLTTNTGSQRAQSGSDSIVTFAAQHWWVQDPTTESDRESEMLVYVTKLEAQNQKKDELLRIARKREEQMASKLRSTVDAERQKVRDLTEVLRQRDEEIEEFNTYLEMLNNNPDIRETLRAIRNQFEDLKGRGVRATPQKQLSDLQAENADLRQRVETLSKKLAYANNAMPSAVNVNVDIRQREPEQMMGTPQSEFDIGALSRSGRPDGERTTVKSTKVIEKQLRELRQQLNKLREMVREGLGAEHWDFPTLVQNIRKLDLARRRSETEMQMQLYQILHACCRLKGTKMASADVSALTPAEYVAKIKEFLSTTVIPSPSAPRSPSPLSQPEPQSINIPTNSNINANHHRNQNQKTAVLHPQLPTQPRAPRADGVSLPMIRQVSNESTVSDTTAEKAAPPDVSLPVTGSMKNLYSTLRDAEAALLSNKHASEEAKEDLRRNIKKARREINHTVFSSKVFDVVKRRRVMKRFDALGVDKMFRHKSKDRSKYYERLWRRQAMKSFFRRQEALLERRRLLAESQNVVVQPRRSTTNFRVNNNINNRAGSNAKRLPQPHRRVLTLNTASLPKIELASVQMDPTASSHPQPISTTGKASVGGGGATPSGPALHPNPPPVPMAVPASSQAVMTSGFSLIPPTRPVQHPHHVPAATISGGGFQFVVPPASTLRGK